jgi:multisubunit Na+/H+ antiporter MnhG subunit
MWPGPWLAMRTTFDRLHYTGPASVLGPIVLAGAVVCREALSTAGIKAVLIAAVLLLTGPVLTHANARALRTRHQLRWQGQAGEEIEEC